MQAPHAMIHGTGLMAKWGTCLWYSACFAPLDCAKLVNPSMLCSQVDGVMSSIRAFGGLGQYMLSRVQVVQYGMQYDYNALPGFLAGIADRVSELLTKQQAK